MIELRTVNLTRYITPLREGGSLPALAEADDEFKYVVMTPKRSAGCALRQARWVIFFMPVFHILFP